MLTETVTNFLTTITHLGLVAEAALADVRTEITNRDLHSAESVADLMVDSNLLTSFQAERVLSGRVEDLIIANRYCIQDLIGSGGMGTVYLANDGQLGRTVALKLLAQRFAQDEEAIARFQRETKALATLSHRNVVQAFDAGSNEGRHFLVMEYVKGESVATSLSECGRVPPARAADFAFQAALGLEHAHSRGLIHRDLKPSNLLIDEGGCLKILDLGLARFLQDQIDDETLTLAGTALGTPDYMAPEQFGAARHADQRSDIYSLGCTLYHMLTARVPFPGSSLSEKCKAHQNQAAEPIHKFSSGVSAGLCEATRRMMAKDPAERFQSASECADALLPYVDSASASLPNLEHTSEWEGSHFRSNFRVSTNVPQRRTSWKVAAAATVGVLMTLAGFAFSGLFNFSTSARNGVGDGGDVHSKSGKKTVGENERKQSGKKPTATTNQSLETNVLTVSLQASDGGRFRSINAAIQAATPGTTIRVLDDATYRERVQLKPKHSGITLESSSGAILLNDNVSPATISILGANDVTLRGFRMQTKADAKRTGTHIGIRSGAGIVLQDLVLTAQPGMSWNGIEVYSINPQNGSPLIVDRCGFHSVDVAILAHGGRGLVIRNNLVREVRSGIHLIGIEDVCVVGNQLEDCSIAGIIMNHVSDGRFLLANNTMFRNNRSLVIRCQSAPKGDIRVQNNLSLAPTGLDFAVYKTSQVTEISYVPGDIAGIAKHWKFSHNCRETKESSDKAWLSPTKEDIRQIAVSGVVRDSKSKDFLSPSSNRKLRLAGAGTQDPLLPTYIGAHPGVGITKRHQQWNRVWRAFPKTGKLLTVSEQPISGGQFRTVNAALKAAQPWSTIRILDRAIYREAVIFDAPAIHTGISLEAPGGATIVAPDPVVSIDNVSFVRLNGLKIRVTQPFKHTSCIRVSRSCSGVQLEGLDIQTPTYSFVGGVFLSNLRIAQQEPPIEIAKCNLAVANDGLVIGGVDDGDSVRESGGVMVVDCRITSFVRGIELKGAISRCLLGGNILNNCAQAGIQIRDPGKRTSLLIANNTINGGGFQMRVWSTQKKWHIQPGQVVLRANVFVGAQMCDLMGGISSGPKSGSISQPLANDVARLWLQTDNFRDLTGTYADRAVPIAPLDKRTDPADFVTRAPSDDDFLRPKKSSSVAQGGSGGDLPSYAGAVPPQGQSPWDWANTWRNFDTQSRHAKRDNKE